MLESKSRSEQKKVRRGNSEEYVLYNTVSPLHMLQCVLKSLERFSRIIKSGHLTVYHAGQLGKTK